MDQMRQAVSDLRDSQRIGWIVYCTATLVESLINGGDDEDLLEAEELVAHLGDLKQAAIIDVTILRLTALLAAARGDDATYRVVVTDYRQRAKSLGYQGHSQWGSSMAHSLELGSTPAS